MVFSDADDEEVTATVQVNPEAMYYWSLQYGEHVVILEPAELRERVRNAARVVYDKYWIWRKNEMLNNLFAYAQKLTLTVI